MNDFTDLDSGEREVLFMTNKEIGLALPKLANIKKWCGDVAAHARSEVAKGNTVSHPELGDYKLVEGKSNRVWKGTQEQVVEGLALEVDDLDKLWEKKLVSPAKAEKLLGKKVDISDLIHKPQGKAVLVPGTDKRDSLEMKVENEFGDIEDE